MEEHNVQVHCPRSASHLSHSRACRRTRSLRGRSIELGSIRGGFAGTAMARAGEPSEMAAQPDPIRKWRDTLLTETHESERRISDIALEAGFSDISHFNWP